MNKFYEKIADLIVHLENVPMTPLDRKTTLKLIMDLESFIAGAEWDLLKILDKYFRDDVDDLL